MKKPVRYAWWVLVAGVVGCGSSNADTAQPPAHAASPTPDEPPVIIPAAATYDDATARACAAHSDCTLVAGVCGGWVGANLTHASAARAYWTNLAMAASCMQNAEVVPPMGAACTDGMCAPTELPHPEWRACNAASDCVAVHEICGGVDAVNRASEAAMTADVRERATRVRCESNTEGALPTPVCRASFCAAY